MSVLRQHDDEERANRRRVNACLEAWRQYESRKQKLTHDQLVAIQDREFRILAGMLIKAAMGEQALKKYAEEAS